MTDKMMFTSKGGRTQTPVESKIMKLYVSTNDSVLTIAAKLNATPELVITTINFWRCNAGNSPEPLNSNAQGTDMAKNDKNKGSRKKIMTKLHEGEAEYSVDMDQIRGILGELEPTQALIIYRCGQSNRVNLRLGEIAIN